MLLLWPSEVRRKREDDFGRIGPALFAGTNNSDSSINKISSISYSCITSCPGFFFRLRNLIDLKRSSNVTQGGESDIRAPSTINLYLLK